jgi:hypothetical protein
MNMGSHKIRLYEGMLDGKRVYVAAHKKDDLRKYLGITERSMVCFQEANDKYRLIQAKKCIGKPIEMEA